MTTTQTIDDKLNALRERLEQANARDYVQRQKLMLKIHQLELQKGD